MPRRQRMSPAPSPESYATLMSQSSFRNQDWLIKVAYDSGEGAGDILWRLGIDGDFKLSSTDQTQWFTHQHDPRYEPASANRLMVLDNGNLRRETVPNGNTRGQVWELDEQAKTATLVVNDDLGRYSLAVGSTERLSNGNYWFDAGFLPDASRRKPAAHRYETQNTEIPAHSFI